MALVGDLVFTDATFTEILADLITSWESSTGETLLESAPERHELVAVATVLSHFNTMINMVGRENFLSFATGDQLDYLGDNFNVDRLSPSFAVTTIQCTLETALTNDYTVPAGVRIESSDGAYIFETDDRVALKPGDTSFTVSATCTTSGDGANDYAVGSINNLLDTLSFDSLNNGDWQNTEITTGGAATESDYRYRERIRLAQDLPSTAGSVNAYKYHTFTTSSDIADVNVYLSDDLSTIYIVFVNTGGTVPNAAQVSAVEEYINSDDIKPISDIVVVEAATADSFNIMLSFDYYSDREMTTEDISDEIESSLTEYTATLKENLGRDVYVNKIRQLAMQVEGVANVNVISPASDKSVDDTDFADIGTITISTGDEVNV